MIESCVHENKKLNNNNKMKMMAVAEQYILWLRQVKSKENIWVCEICWVSYTLKTAIQTSKCVCMCLLNFYSNYYKRIRALKNFINFTKKALKQVSSVCVYLISEVYLTMREAESLYRQFIIFYKFFFVQQDMKKFVRTHTHFKSIQSL